MNYTIDFDSEKEIVKVAYAGRVSLDERVQAVKDVTRTYAKYMPLKILIDVRDLKMHLSLEEQKHFGQYLSNHKGLAEAKVAVLHPSDHNPNLLVDIHAFNNGYRLAEFEKRQVAQTWLLEA